MRIIVFFSIFLCALPARAAPSCDAVAHDFISLIGAKLVRRGSGGGSYFLSHPAAKFLTVYCPPGPVSVSVAVDGAPTPDFLLLARVAAIFVSGHVDRNLPVAIEGCLLAARNAVSESAETQTAHVDVQCSSFAADGHDSYVNVAAR